MITILETKLRAPAARSSAVDRSRLLDRLRIGPEVRLVLVSAPPGFGKSTLTTQWIAAALPPDSAVAWLSLEASDDEPATFWTYVIAAITSVAPDAATGARAALEQDAGRPDQVIAALLNGLAGVTTRLVLVLDDLHVIARREIHDGLAFLLDHLPAGIHLAVLTRADPPLPLSRLRARGQLVELRAADLRFTEVEAATYLNDRMGLDLGGAAIATLESRTEGWIAALQLAALSMQGRDDGAAFIAEFAGDDRFVVDYLADEVMERQTDEVRDFLLATAVLDRLTGPLCDALTGRTDGAATLEALERANLFLVPLDDRRRWYRYHHLFADLLRARLRELRPSDVAALHRRASAWWETQGALADAIDHALAGGDPEHAADMIETAAPALRQTRQEATLRRWLDALPDAVFAHRPVLAMGHVGALLSTGEARGVAARLDAAERWLPAAAGPEARAQAEAAGMIVRHPTALAHLPSAIPLHRAALASMQGDLATTIAHATIALAAAPEDQPLERGGAGGVLALARWANGDLEEAYDTWAVAVEELGRAGHRADMLGGFLAMTDIRLTQGRVADARRAVERGLAIGQEATPPLRGTADMLVALAEVLMADHDLEGARARLDASILLGEALGLPQHPWRRRVALAQLHAAEGDPATADALLDEAGRVYVADMFPEVRPIGSVRARLWVREGRVADALAWAAERRLTPHDELRFLHEHAHITLAAALVARARSSGDGDAALEAGVFIDRLLAAAEAGGRGRSVAELRALRAGSAEPARQPRSAATPAARALVEPLSERELEVLRLLDSDLTGPEIAARLFISLSTLRTHTRNIFAKLDVSSRRAAMTRAVELGLLSRDR